MVEYIIVLRSIASGANLQSFFDLDSTKGIVFALLAGVALFIVGYLIKGIWGAIIAFSIGVFIFFYLKG
jgi:hypothetical protein